MSIGQQVEFRDAEPTDVSVAGEPRIDAGAVESGAVIKLRLLWDNRRLLFRSVFLGIVLFLIVAFLIPTEYESTVRLMPPDDQSDSGIAMASILSGKMNGGLAGLAGDVLGLKSSGDLFIGILRSRTVQDDLISKFNLKRIYRTRFLQTARQELSDKTEISQDRKSGIITIAVTDKDPERAAAMAEEYVSELNSVVTHLTTSSAHRERIFLEGRLAQVQQDLENAEKDFSQFASKNGTIDIKEQGKSMVASVATLEGQLIATQSELEGFKQIYSDNNVRVRALNARIAELRSELAQLGGKSISDKATGEKNLLYPSIRELPLLGVSYADLYRQMQVKEAVFETLTQEYELAKVAEAKEIPSVKVLDPANVPEKKSFPPRLRIVILGTILFTGCIVVWVLVKTRWEEMDPQDPRKVLIMYVNRQFNADIRYSRMSRAVQQVWMRFFRKTP